MVRFSTIVILVGIARLIPTPPPLGMVIGAVLTLVGAVLTLVGVVLRLVTER